MTLIVGRDHSVVAVVPQKEGRRVLLLSDRAFDFRAAALADVSDLNQAIAEFDCLALLRPHRFMLFRCHSTPTARTDHNRLLRAWPHG